jgi:hypothetical protein
MLVGGASATASPATPRKRKGAGINDDDTPTKKRPKPKNMKVVDDGPTNDLGDGLPNDIDQFST